MQEAAEDAAHLCCALAERLQAAGRISDALQQLAHAAAAACCCSLHDEVIRQLVNYLVGMRCSIAQHQGEAASTCRRRMQRMQVQWPLQFKACVLPS